MLQGLVLSKLDTLLSFENLLIALALHCFVCLLAVLESGFKLLITSHELAIFIKSDAHLILAFLYNLSELLNHLICLFKLVLILDFGTAAFFLNILLFKCEAINAHLLINEFLLQSVVLDFEVLFVFFELLHL